MQIFKIGDDINSSRYLKVKSGELIFVCDEYTDS